MSVAFTQEQRVRLRNLGVAEAFLEREHPGAAERDEAFRLEERRLASLARRALDQAFAAGARPPVETLAEDLSRLLSGLGLVQVSTPIIMSRVRLVRMGLENDPLLADQVFWLNEKKCLRPMLAPHLYEYMLDLVKLRSGPFGLFEVGPCFRRESQGARHANEFTMLNLVEVGLPLEARGPRLEELAGLLMERAGLRGWRLETADSGVYGQTVDVVAENGLELASCSLGPHPLDEAWGFSGSWVGLGLGLERLAMALAGSDRLSSVSRGLGRILGTYLRL
ncbi:MAG: pyrrolysine--tRNA(Pyl) ligase large subunit [Deltaproteobacteria bacterium]|jgi:phenylalanyl-tRNA synthetase alpha chain|nr:pyrrolysine--tRNA(Pyl) ligase large subunit [Deltaproteobacteria bacterium]